MIIKNLKIKTWLLSLLFALTIISCTDDELNEVENEIEEVGQSEENEDNEQNQKAKIELLTKIDATDIVIGPIVSIKTNITDEDGEVTEASLLINGEVIETISSTPFNFSWDTSLEDEGEYTIEIIARDNDQAKSNLETAAVLTANFTCGNDFFDPRDGNIYKTVKIGDQCWMAENLNYQIDGGSWNYDDSSENGEIYGKLYDRESAQIASPDGWHLPTDEEWQILEGTVDSQVEVGSSDWQEWGYRGTDAGKNLKSVTGWEEDGNGVDKFGFNALPGGYKFFNPGPDGTDHYENLYISAPFWTSSSAGVELLWARELFAEKSGIHKNFYDNWAFAIRCIKN